MKLCRLFSLITAVICCVCALKAFADTSAAAETNTISDEIQGVYGTVFSIERPDASALTVVNASDFGLSA